MKETALYVGTGVETLRTVLGDRRPEERPNVFATTTVSDAVDQLVDGRFEYLLIGSGVSSSDVRVLLRLADTDPSMVTLCHRRVNESLSDDLSTLVDGTFDPDESETCDPLAAFGREVREGPSGTDPSTGETDPPTGGPGPDAVDGESGPGAVDGESSPDADDGRVRGERAANRLACLDRDGTYLWVNEPMADSIGEPDAEIVGNSIERAPPRDLVGNVPEFWTHASRTETKRRAVVSTDDPQRAVTVHSIDEDRVLLIEEPHEADFTFDGEYLDRLSDLFFIVDFNGALVYWNEVVSDVTGYTDAELATLNAFELFRPEDRERAVEAIEDVRTTGERSVELQLITKDGETIPYQFSGSLVEDGEGDPQYVCGIGRDITDKVEMQAEIEAVIDELKQSNDELEHFAYVASHDLKEPLRTVQSFLEILETRYGSELGTDGEEYIEFAINGASRMSSMIDDLLEYSRVSGDVSFETVDTNEVFQEVSKNLQLTIAESGATLSSDPLPAIAADRSLIVQLFQNLVDNAIKHAEDEPRIHVTAERVGEMVQFTVTDENEGMTDAETEDIFELFSTGHDETGSGIGLATCKKIVDSHGGAIGVESEKGVGSAFFFTLPVTPPSDEQPRNVVSAASVDPVRPIALLNDDGESTDHGG